MWQAWGGSWPRTSLRTQRFLLLQFVRASYVSMDNNTGEIGDLYDLGQGGRDSQGRTIGILLSIEKVP